MLQVLLLQLLEVVLVESGKYIHMQTVEIIVIVVGSGVVCSNSNVDLYSSPLSLSLSNSLSLSLELSPSRNTFKFTLDCLHDLNTSLTSRGSCLIVFKGKRDIFTVDKPQCFVV
jgi:hypothetical protein